MYCIISSIKSSALVTVGELINIGLFPDPSLITTGSSVLLVDFVIAAPDSTSDIKFLILDRVSIVYCASSDKEAIAPAAEIAVLLSSAPRTTVLAGTIIGRTSSYRPVSTCTVV